MPEAMTVQTALNAEPALATRPLETTLMRQIRGDIKANRQVGHGIDP